MDYVIKTATKPIVVPSPRDISAAVPQKPTPDDAFEKATVKEANSLLDPVMNSRNDQEEAI